ncbi:DoxX family protein [Paenibacillus sp. KS-LC4]|uniref:DoxX family protein n=1 Tax=Paenibacillus sp. KS-LC4 TaxID=2979727 RepID=UPI0030CA5F17
MKWLVRILQGLLVLGFLMFGFMKVSGDSAQVAAFNDIYGYGTAFMYVVGVVEILGAVGLLIGYWRKQLIPIFSGLLAAVMAGAVFTHFKAGQGFEAAGMPLILLVLALIVLFGQIKLLANDRP